MAYVIGLVSQKGGVGKSSLARMLAREFVVGGMSTKVGDLDSQQLTCVTWSGRRAENGVTPEIRVEPFASVKTALADAGRFDALVLDGRPHASEQTVEIAHASDLVIIPTGQTLDDLHPGVILAHSLRKKGVSADRIAFALFRTTGSDRENAAARDYIAEAGYLMLAGDVASRTGYGAAQDLGRAITETPYKTLNSRAAALAQSVIDRLVELEVETA